MFPDRREGHMRVQYVCIIYEMLHESLTFPYNTPSKLFALVPRTLALVGRLVLLYNSLFVFE